MKVHDLLARYLPHPGHGLNATACHPLGVVDNLSASLEFDPHFVMFVEAFVPWAISQLQSSNHQALSIQPGR
jgi:hypothetical protein